MSNKWASRWISDKDHKKMVNAIRKDMEKDVLERYGRIAQIKFMIATRLPRILSRLSNWLVKE